MHPIRVVRRLLSRAREDWQDAVDGLFAPPPARRPVGPRPLRVMRLERRRVLSADFTLSASGLLLSGFDDAGGDTLTVQQESDAYQFTSANGWARQGGWEQHETSDLPAGVTIDGDTLSVDRGVLEALSGGLTIEGSLGHRLDVRLGDADFSGMAGPVTLVGATGVGATSASPEQPFALFTAPTDGLNLIVSPSGAVLSSLNLSGDLNIVAVGGSITDSPGSEIIISGNATFVSRAASPAGDFDGDSDVDNADRTEHWARYYGMTSGASRFDGDANGDGSVDAADYTLWRDSLGQTGNGGIELANEAGDRLVIGGVATFDAAESGGVHDIFVGVGGHAEFGSVNAYGANVVIHEDTTVGDSGPTTVLGDIQANTLQVVSAGKIEAPVGSVILVEGAATLTSLHAQPGGGGAADLSGGILVAGRFEAGGLVTLFARDGTGDADAFDIEVADAATANFGSLSATGAAVTVYEDGGTFKPQRDGSQAGTLINGVAAQQLLVHSAGPITDAAGSQVTVHGDATFVVSEAAMIADGELAKAIVLADGGSANTLTIDGVATFIVEWPTTGAAGFGGPKGVDVGVVATGLPANATFNAGSLRFYTPGGTARIAEDGDMVLAGWGVGDAATASVAHTLLLYGNTIFDDADAVVRVTGVAADGSLVYDPTANATFYAYRNVVLADAGTANELSIDGLCYFAASVPTSLTPDIDVGVTATGVAATATFNAGSLRFVTSTARQFVRIAEDSATVLTGRSTAKSLELTSAGSITDDATFSLQVDRPSLDMLGNATFVAKDEIVLADSQSASNYIDISGLATFVSTDGDAITIGVDSAGKQAGAFFGTGSLRFITVGGDVRIAEDHAVSLAGWDPGSIAPSIQHLMPTASIARNLELFGSSISDADNAVVNVTGNATFVASVNITLADTTTEGTTNALTVGGVATFVTSSSEGMRIGTSSTSVAAPAIFQAGSLRFYTPNGFVSIAEDDGLHFADWMSAPVSPLIVLPPNGTPLMASSAPFIEVSSAGSITDAADAAVFATRWNGANRDYTPNASATFVAAGSITLADGGADNKLMVDGLATFVSTADPGQRVDVGVTAAGGMAAAEFIAGGVRFSAPGGAVRLAEDAAIHFKDATYAETPGTVIGSFTGSVNSPLIPNTVVSNRTGSLAIVSSGPITDAASAVTEVTGDASFRVVGPSVATEGNYAIRLADGEASNRLVIDGLATFIVEPPPAGGALPAGPQGIDVGVTFTGLAAGATFNAGSLRFAAPGGTVRIAEDSSTLLAAWTPGDGPTASEARTIEVHSEGSITDAIDAVIFATGSSGGNRVYDPTSNATFVAVGSIVLADAGAGNKLMVDGVATFVSTADTPQIIHAGVNSLLKIADAEFTAGGLRFYVSEPRGSVRFAEDAFVNYEGKVYSESLGTVLESWATEAIGSLLIPNSIDSNRSGSLEIVSYGPITDAVDALTRVQGDAGFRVIGSSFDSPGEYAIRLADGELGNTLSVLGAAIFIVDGEKGIDVGVRADGTLATAEFTSRSLRFYAPSGAVRVAEDDLTSLGSWVGTPLPLISPDVRINFSHAGSIDLYSADSITDSSSADVRIAGDASFFAKYDIALVDGGNDTQLMVGGTSTFVVGQGRLLSIGVSPEGQAAIGRFQAGSLRFSAPNGLARIAEDDGTLLADWMTVPPSPLIATPPMATEARTIEVLSAGSITDAPGAVVIATGRDSGGAQVYDPTASATFVAAQSITLADGGADNKLIVDGAANFVSTTETGQRIDVGVTPAGGMASAEFVAGSLRFWAQGGAVRLVEDASASFKGVAYAETPGTVIDTWTIGPFAPIVPNNLGAQQASSLEIVSNGPITDVEYADLVITGDAGFRVIGSAVPTDGDYSIRLADGSSNRLRVQGAVTFVVDGARGIDAGVNSTGASGSGEFSAGALRFNAGGAVRIAEDDATLLADWSGLAVGLIRPDAAMNRSLAGSLELFTPGLLTDAETAVVQVNGAATLRGAQGVTLADGGDDRNQLLVDGLATFVGANLNVGVTSAGLQAPAVFRAGSLRFYAPNGAARFAEDDSTLLAGWPMGSTPPLLGTTPPMATEAKTIEVYSAGSITDAADAVVIATGVSSGRDGGRAYDPTASATFVAAQSITLADGGADNKLIVDGVATFVSTTGSAQRIDVGVTAAGDMATAEFVAGSVRFSAPGGAVRLVEDASASFKGVTYAETPGTVIAGWGAPVSPLVPSSVSRSTAQTLELVSNGPITDAVGAVAEVAGSAGFRAIGTAATTDGNYSIRLADQGAGNRLIVGGAATFVVDGARGVDVGVAPAGAPAAAEFTAGSLRFVAGGSVRIAEDNASQFAGWADQPVGLIRTAGVNYSQANSLALVSAGPITDAGDAVVDVTLDAGFLVTDAAGLDANAKAITLAGDNSASSVNRLSVGGFATFVTLGGGGIDLGVTVRGEVADATFNAGALRFYAPGATVRIAEDSGTSLAKATTEGVLGLGGPLPASVAGTLLLTSNGVISDEATAAVDIAEDATFVVSPTANLGDDRAIVLANQGGPSNRLSVGGLASFNVTSPNGIDVGVTAAGTPAGAVFTAGRLAFTAPSSSVRVAEDDGTLFAGGLSRVGEMQLLSAGAIGDEARTNLQVDGNATFVAALGTQLADGAADNQLSVGGLGTFVVGQNQTLAVGTSATGAAAAAAFNAGSLRFDAPNGTARIAEDSATQLVDWMTVAPSPIIAAPPMATEAKTIEVFSAGSITDTPTSVVIATGNSGGVRVYDPAATATFVAAGSITLADAGADNKLIVDGMLTLLSTTGTAQQIDVGVTGAGAAAGAEFVAGSVRFSTPGGAVRLAEDAGASYKGVAYNETPGTHLAGWTPGTISALIVTPPVRSAAASLDVTSAGAITDAADAKVLVTGDAKFTVSTIASVAGPTAITLADGGAANELVIGAHANFLVNQVPAGSPKGIDVGVVPATGAPAAALFTAGTLGFGAQGGMVRLAEDNDTVLGGFSTAQDLELLSAGAITDTTSVTTGEGVTATSVSLTQTAKLKAGVNGENDVTLGAGSAVFDMSDSAGNDPQLFSDAQYLAVQARNVSVHADSAVNVLTGDAPLSNLDNYSQFAGTFYLTAAGSVTQVTTATPTPLTADKISVASDNGAVLLRLVELTGDGADPNLQIKSGGSVSLDQPLVGGGTVGDKFAGANIPSTDNSVYSPVIVEADDPVTGVRPDQPARTGNPGFEDVLADDGENARLSEAVRQASGNYPVDHDLQYQGQTRTIDNLYASVVIVRGDAVVGDVHDPNTGARRDFDADEARGVEATDAGNVFLATTAGGDLLFTNRNREGEPGVLDAVAVQMAGGVFTAVAAGTLRIDTEDADNLAPGLRTTRLVSKTGTVTDVNSDSATQFGPRALLDTPTEEANAATSGLVRADQAFEQRVTLALGSRGEDNVLVEVEWADVADIRTHSNANVRLTADPNAPTNTVGSTSVLGSSLYADVVQTPVGAIESNVASPAATTYAYQQLEGSTRVGTITHNYDESFVPNNPAQNRLPTTIRVFNDSSINLFDHGGANGALRDLNSASFSIAPRIITLPPPGYFIITQIDLPQQVEHVTTTTPRHEPTQATQQTQDDSGRAVAVSSAEDILYGRVDEKGDWITDIPGESWPQVLEDAEGDFLREIRDKIDEGPYSKGRYIIKVVTPRSEQLLEEWVKGDDADAAGKSDSEAAAPPAAAIPAEEAVQPAEKPLPAAPGRLDPLPAPAEDAPFATPQGAPLGLMERDLTESDASPAGARNAAFAAMAAVGVWRRRLNEAGPFTLDADGVAFTRVKRQRRRRGGD